MTPEVGRYYEARGFLFRVDDVQGGEVYLVRWKLPDQEQGMPCRVDLSVWKNEMREAKEKS